MDIAVLIRMANDIAHFFEAYPDQDKAAREIAGHLKSFWDPAMRGQLVAHVQGGGEGLSESVKRAAALI